MDRLDLCRKLAGCGLALTLALAGAGCKTPKSEVPPSPTFSGTNQAPIGFSQEPNPMSGAANAGMGQPGGGQFGIPNPATPPNYGMPGSGFSGPGTNLGTQSMMPAPSTMPGASALTSPGGAANPATNFPQTGTGATGPAAGVGAAPTQNPF